jgi:integrase
MPKSVRSSSKSTESEGFTILDGKCHLFRRENSSFWWCGFHHKGKYVRSSTKQSTPTAAEVFAREWYFKKQNEIASGKIANPSHTFEKVSKLAVEHYKTLVDRKLRSPVTLEGIKSILDSRVSPYFKKMLVAEIDNTTWHSFKTHILEKYPNASRGTLHQYKNAVRVVLNEAFRRGMIKQVPVFKDEYSSRKIEHARPWFDSNEYKRLHTAILAHANRLKKTDKLLHKHAMELYDYVIFATNTGMRVGELNNLRFMDVQIVQEKMTGKEVLIISNIKGKRGTGICQSYYGAVAAFRRRIEARGIEKPSKSQEKVFLIHHRTMFNNILEKKKLKFSKTVPPSRRDFVSLRATYICFRLLNGVPVYEIANNCRTSVAMIEQSYARHLGGRLMPNINRTASEGWDY